MKAFVDKDACIGCGVCVELCPEVFELDQDGLAQAVEQELNDEIVNDVKQAQGDCPVEAIHVE